MRTLQGVLSRVVMVVGCVGIAAAVAVGILLALPGGVLLLVAKALAPPVAPGTPAVTPATAAHAPAVPPPSADVASAPPAPTQPSAQAVEGYARRLAVQTETPVRVPAGQWAAPNDLRRES